MANSLYQIYLMNENSGRLHLNQANA